ncbi:hypothetical protein H8N03_21460 [Ramlibacter sp. USB13]|uniref:Uncharacterized protein n=1 Tax=Ramlibacter cellulosilyticus TaxID=2764187 RepID=A0A923MTG0_9BURK|nr:hypothetical protein [Ramlibacter cellulosilyticus]MBC5785522.1 hypothetical protein [Ramlibacter cellulosilyticus]
MNDMKEERQDDGARPSRNDTVTAQGENQAPKARQPHEHDESADSQAADSPQIREMGEIAHRAATSGQQDTSKAQETDATYHRVRETADPAPVDKASKNRKAG